LPKKHKKDSCDAEQGLQQNISLPWDWVIENVTSF